MALALSQDKYMCLGYKQQKDLTTALAAADMWTLTGTQMDIQAKPIDEDNAADLGKGVYATNTYPSHIEAGGSWNGLATAESLAAISAFWVSKLQKAVSGDGFKYTMVAPVFATDGLDMAVNTIAVKVGAVQDKALIGLACNEFGLQMQTGPGRQNCQFTSNWVGTGKYANPSNIVFPAATAEHSLTAGSLETATIIGFDYKTTGRLNTLNLSLNNNIRQGYFPASGSQSGYQLQGRMRRGVPSMSLTAKVECDSASSEEATLLAGTEGTGVIYLKGAALGASFFSWKITFHRLKLKATPLGDADGIATWDCEYAILEHSVNGVFTIEAICDQDDILTAAA